MHPSTSRSPRGRRLILAGAGLLGLLIAFHGEPVSTHSIANTTVTFDKEISRIIRKRCISCHSDRNIGVPLTAYEQVRPWSGSMHEEVLRRHMPPWRAVAGYAEFVNDPSLTSRELQFLTAWIDGNGPKGKEKIIFNFETMHTPEAERIKGDFDRWQLGQPDLVRVLAPVAVLPGEGDTVRSVEVDLGLRSSRPVRAIEFRPGDRRVVRAVSFRVKETGQWLGNWTAWYPMLVLPEDAAFSIPAGAHVVADISYRSTEEPVQERGTFGLYFGSKSARTPSELTIRATPGPEPVTSAGSAGGRFTGTSRLDVDTQVVALLPDVPADTTAFSVTAREPNGATRPLLVVREPLVEWPTPYILKTPITLPAGTQIVLTSQSTMGGGGGEGQDPIALRILTLPLPGSRAVPAAASGSALR